MSLVKIPFISGAYQSRSVSIDCQRCINLYPEKETADSKNVAALIGTPGMRIFTTNTTLLGETRGVYCTSTGRLFQVRDRTVYEFGPNGEILNATFMSLLTVKGKVNIADNGIEMVIVDGSYGYLYNLTTNNLSRITSGDFPNGATHVVFKDGYFVANNPTTNQFNLYWSGLYDGATWSALNVVSAEGSPDKLIAISKTNNELWCFGEQSTEVFANTGDASLVFARVNGAFFDFGTQAIHSVATNGNTVFWLGSNANGNNTIFAATGYTPQRISTHAIEFIIGQLNTTSDAVGYCYQQEGHSFYVLSFLDGNLTLVYDISTDMWHERRSYNKVTNEQTKWRGLYHAFFNGKNLVADNQSTFIYELDLDYYYEDSTDIYQLDPPNQIIRTRATPHIHNFNKRLFYSSLEIDVQKGVGTISGQGKTPQMMLRYSNDGGFTWSSEIWTSIGAMGQYKNRAKFMRLGMARDRVFEITISDPVKVVLIDAYAEVSME